MMSWICNSCPRTFNSAHAATQHMNALDHGGHLECYTCTRMFGHEQDLYGHMNDLGHWGVECQTCCNRFANKEAQEDHMDCFDHWAHYCSPCGRGFKSDNNLKMHLHSRAHRGADVPCPFCSQSFVTASGLAHHLESGTSCRESNLNRTRLYHIIRKRDRAELISEPTVLPSDILSSAWNGSRYECIICCKEFKRQSSLRQHVTSLIHSRCRYYCPSQNCRKEIANLAGLLNHLESGTCGYMSIEDVAACVQDLVNGNDNEPIDLSPRPIYGISGFAYASRYWYDSSDSDYY